MKVKDIAAQIEKIIPLGLSAELGQRRPASRKRG